MRRSPEAVVIGCYISVEHWGKASLIRGWRMGFYIIRRWTIEQPLALWTYDDEFISSRWWACELLCSFLLPSEGVPACCDGCASLASLYTSHTASTLLTRLRCHPMNLFLSSIELLTLTRASVSVYCVLLSLCTVCFCLCDIVLLPRNCRRRRAWCYGLNRWLWLVMAGSEVLFGIRNRIWTLCRRPGRSRTTLKQYFWMTPQANGPMCKDFGQSFSEEINFEGQRLKNLYNIMFKQFDLSLCHLFVTHQ